MKLYVLVLALTLALPSAAVASVVVDYTVTPEIGASGATALRVEMRFAGDADGETTIALPQAIADQNDLWRGVEDLRVVGATVDPATQPQTRVLHHRPNAPLTLSYRIVQTFDGEPSFDKPLLRPIFQPAWFAVQGEGLFVQVEGRAAALTRFHWGVVPAGWTAVSDAEQTPGARGAPFDDLRESILIGGRDVRITQSQAAGGRLRVASLGAPGFDVPQFLSVFQRAAAAGAHMWGDRGRDYLVAVIPIPAPPDVAGQLGWSRRDGFALYVTPTVDEPTLVHVVTHEYMHSWFPDAFGVIAPENFGTEAWFGEGFTDYYADRALLASGVWSLEDFAARYQRVVSEYWSSPVRNQTNVELAHFFDGGPGPVQRMSYLRGALIAARWDRRIRSETHGRENLRTVLLVAKASRTNATPVTRLLAAARTAGVDLSSDLAVLSTGRDIDLSVDAFGQCIAVNAEQAPSYDRGFPPVVLGEAVSAVDPTSRAHAAGLRTGMIMVERIAGVSGDSRVEQVWRVRDGSTERTIRFFPQGSGTAMMHDVVVTPNLSPAQRAACAREIVDSGGR